MPSVFFSPWKFSHSRRRWACRSFVGVLKGKLQASWIQVDGSSDGDVYGGWYFDRVDATHRDGFPSFVLSGIGTYIVAILLAGAAHYFYSRKCFTIKLSAPFGIFHDISGSSGISEGITEVTKATAPFIHEAPVESSEDKFASGENKCIVVPVPADPAQLEALYSLKKLKIIDYDANADDLCTKREYARWLVKANCILERKAKHKIIPMSLNPGTFVPAFDDVNIDDPDFWCIQALGEAGIVSSRLFSSKFTSLPGITESKEDERFYFFPDNFISCIDMLNWRTLLEYPIFSDLEEKISSTKLHLWDLNARELDIMPQLLMDLMSGDGSLVRKTFGNVRRLQPAKPVTKAQAAVSLTSGRMADGIRTELSRLEAENLSKLAEMEEIRVELIREGVTKQWEEKLSEEKNCALQVDGYLESELFDLEIERAVQEEKLADYVKAKANLECQQKMLFTFKKDVDEKREKLACERVVFTAEKQKVEIQLKHFHEERVAVLEAKSAIEAKKEAIQMLRSWVEEEGRKIRARGEVLERAAQRWRL